MEPRVRVTLDNPILRDRIRRSFEKPDYSQKINRSGLKTTVLSDITVRKVRSKKVLARPSVPNHLAHQVSTNSIEADTKASQDFSKPVIETIGYIDNTHTQDDDQKSQAKFVKYSFRTKIKKYFKFKNKNKLQLLLVSLAVIFIMLGGYVSIMGFKANSAAALQATKLTQLANKAAKSSSVPASVPATIKPTTSSVANFVVAPNLPRYIIIPSIGVDAEVRSIGLTSSGALGVPDNVYYTDWYDESSLPGQQGAMLIDGHVSSWTAHGVFYSIKDLVAGDIIKIERGDGKIFTYTVVKHQIYPSGNVNMASAMKPVVAGQPGLNLITCTGDVIPGTSLFNERIIVYATLQQS